MCSYPSSQAAACTAFIRLCVSRLETTQPDRWSWVSEVEPRALPWCHPWGQGGFVEGPRGGGSSSLWGRGKILLIFLLLLLLLVLLPCRHLVSLGNEWISHSCSSQKDLNYNSALLPNSGADTGWASSFSGKEIAFFDKQLCVLPYSLRILAVIKVFLQLDIIYHT